MLPSTGSRKWRGDIKLKLHEVTVSASVPEKLQLAISAMSSNMSLSLHSRHLADILKGVPFPRA